MYTLLEVNESLAKFWLPALYHRLPVNFSITHNWLGSLRRRKSWLLTIVWSNFWGKYRVFLTVTFIRSIGRIAEPLLILLSMRFNPIYLIKLLSFSETLTSGLGARALLFFSAWSDQFIFTNKCLPTIPIIQPSKFVSMEGKQLEF